LGGLGVGYAACGLGVDLAKMVLHKSLVLLGTAA